MVFTQCSRLTGKTRLRNDLLCVEWDAKPHPLTRLQSDLLYVEWDVKPIHSLTDLSNHVFILIIFIPNVSDAMLLVYDLLLLLLAYCIFILFLSKMQFTENARECPDMCLITVDVCPCESCHWLVLLLCMRVKYARQEFVLEFYCFTKPQLYLLLFKILLFTIVFLLYHVEHLGYFHIITYSKPWEC